MGEREPRMPAIHDNLINPFYVFVGFMADFKWVGFALKRLSNELPERRTGLENATRCHLENASSVDLHNKNVLGRSALGLVTHRIAGESSSLRRKCVYSEFNREVAQRIP